MNAAEANPLFVFRIKCRIVRWLDADTPCVHPIYETAGHDRHVRLKDEYAVEKEQEGHDAALALAKLQIGDEGNYVWIANDRHHKDRERIEARVDPF